MPPYSALCFVAAAFLAVLAFVATPLVPAERSAVAVPFLSSLEMAAASASSSTSKLRAALLVMAQPPLEDRSVPAMPMEPTPLLLGLLLAPTASAVLVASGTPPYGCAVVATSTSLGAYCASAPIMSRFSYKNLTWSPVNVVLTANKLTPSSGPLLFLNTTTTYDERCNCTIKVAHIQPTPAQIQPTPPVAVPEADTWYGNDAGLLFRYPTLDTVSPELITWSFADAALFPTTIASFTVLWQGIGSVPWNSKTCFIPFQYWFESLLLPDVPFQLTKVCFQDAPNPTPDTPSPLYSSETATWSRSRGWLVVNQMSGSSTVLQDAFKRVQPGSLTLSPGSLTAWTPTSGANNVPISTVVGTFKASYYTGTASLPPYYNYYNGVAIGCFISPTVAATLPLFTSGTSEIVYPLTRVAAGPSSTFSVDFTGKFTYASLPAVESILSGIPSVSTTPFAVIALKTYIPFTAFNSTSWKLAVARYCAAPLTSLANWTTANPVLTINPPITIPGLYFVCASEDSGVTWTPTRVSITVTAQALATALTVQPTFTRTSLCASTYQVRFLGARVSASVYPNRVSLGAPCGTFYSAPVDVDDQMFPAWPLPPDPPATMPACYSTDNGTTWVQQQAVLYVVPSGSASINTDLALSPSSVNPSGVGPSLIIVGSTPSPAWAPTLYRAALIRTLPLAGADLTCPGSLGSIAITSSTTPLQFNVLPALGTYTLCTSLDGGLTWTLQPSATVTVTAAPLASYLSSIDPPQSYSSIAGQSTFFGLGPAFLTPLPSSGAMSGAPLYLTLPTLVRVGSCQPTSKTFEVVSNDPVLTVPVLPVGIYVVCVSTDQGVNWKQQSIPYQVVAPPVDPTPSPLAVASFISVTPATALINTKPVLTVTGQGFVANSSTFITWNGVTCINLRIVNTALPVILTCNLPLSASPVVVNATLVLTYIGSVIVDPAGKVISSGGIKTLTTTHYFAYQSEFTSSALLTVNRLLRLPEGPTALWFTVDQDATIELSVVNAAGEPSRVISVGIGQATSDFAPINITFPRSLNLRGGPAVDICSVGNSSGVVGGACVVVQSKGRASGVMHFKVVRGDPALIQLPAPIPMDFAPRSKLEVSWYSPVNAATSALCPSVSNAPSVNIALNMTSWPDPLFGKSVSVLVTISSTNLGSTTDNNITNQTINFSDREVQYLLVPNPAFNRSVVSFRTESSSEYFSITPLGGLTVCSSKLLTVRLPTDPTLPVGTVGNITLTLDALPTNGTLTVTFIVSRRGYSSCSSGCTIVDTPVVNFTTTSMSATKVSFTTPAVAAVDDISVLLSGDAADEYVATFQGARTFISVGGNVTVSQRRGDCEDAETKLLWAYPIFVNLTFAPPPNTILVIRPVPSHPSAIFSPPAITVRGSELSLSHRLKLEWQDGVPLPSEKVNVTFNVSGNASGAYNQYAKLKDPSVPWLLLFHPVLETICNRVFINNEVSAKLGYTFNRTMTWFQPRWISPSSSVTILPYVATANFDSTDNASRNVGDKVMTLSGATFSPVSGGVTPVNLKVTILKDAQQTRYFVSLTLLEPLDVELVPFNLALNLSACNPGEQPDGNNGCTLCSISTFGVDGRSCRDCKPGRGAATLGSTSEAQCTCLIDPINRLLGDRPCMLCNQTMHFIRGAAMPCVSCPNSLAPVFLYSLLLAASALYGAAHKTHSFIWTYFELSVQSMQVCGLLTITSPWSVWGSAFAVLNLDLRAIFMPCLIRDPFFMQIVRALVPAAAFGSAYAMGVWKRRRNLQYSALNDFKLIRPARYSRIVWFFAVPVAAWALENFDCVRDPYSPETPETSENAAKYMRFVPSELCSPSNGRWVLMNVVAACGFAAVCICFPLFALIKALRKKDRVKLWAVVWYVARLALVINAFALAPRSADCLRFGDKESSWPGHKCYFQLIPIGVMAPILSIVAALLLRVWGENVVPYLGLSVLSVSYTLISASPFGRKSFVLVGLVIGFVTFVALAVHAIFEHRKEAARRWQRDVQEAQEEDEASFQFLMPRAILRDVLEPRGEDGLLFGASFAAGPASAAARDSLHPCHGLLEVIKSELERAPADRALAWQPTLTRVALTHHRTLSRAFRQRLQLIADPKRVQLRRPWPEDGRGDERSAASRVLESHLGRITEIATALGDIVDRRPSAGSRAGSRAGAVSSGSAIELQVVAAPSPRIQSGGTSSEHDPLGLVQLAAAGLDLVWHGPSGGVKAIDTICRTGFVNLATLNTGWHGRGLYFTHWAQYADYYFLCGGHRPENLTPQGEHALLLSWALVGAAYPVLARMDRVDDPEHTFHGGYPGYDSHYALVNDGGITCTEYLPTPQAKYDEVMISQESQVLPLAVVFFKLA